MLSVFIDDDILNRARINGPNIRSRHLYDGLITRGVEFTTERVVSEQNAAIHPGVFNSMADILPANTPVGPSIVHEARSHSLIATKFKNIIVQAPWVADYWCWYDKEITKDCKFFIWPSGVDTDLFSPADTEKQYDCLWYHKYQNGENKAIISDLLRKFGQSYKAISYDDGYTQEEFIRVCRSSRYCLFQSCCEKSSHALLEMMSCGLPAFVIDSRKWIGDDKFDRCTSAPDWEDRCGRKAVYDSALSEDFQEFISRQSDYKPRDYVIENRTLKHFIDCFLLIVKACHPCE